jgi:hypothetical protein
MCEIPGNCTEVSERGGRERVYKMAPNEKGAATFLATPENLPNCIISER